jgi:hypothetical protein
MGSDTILSFMEETGMVDSNLLAAGLQGAARQASDCRAKQLEPSQRGELALDVLTRTRSAAQVAREEGVSRKFVATQVGRARQAIHNAFEPGAPDTPGGADERVLFTLPVTDRLIRRLVLALILCCHSSYRGVLEVLSDVFGIVISLGKIHNIARAAAQSARQINDRVDLAGVRIGAHDEIFQNGQPVLVGCDVKSTYCYLLSQEQHRDADTWGLRLLELGDHGWQPEATIADGGRGLRAGQELAYPGLPCRGDVFHAVRELGQVATYLENRAYGTITACEQQERHMKKAKRKGRGQQHSKRLAQARQEEAHAVRLAADVSLLASWLQNDVLAVAGPDVTTRRGLFDFLVVELERLAPQCSHRLTPVIRALRNQRDDLLAFAEELDLSLAAVAAEHHVPVDVMRDVLLLLAPCTTQQWQAEAALRRRLGERFHAVRTAVAAIAERTVRASSVVENINSRLRSYFFLRRHLGTEYLDLLRFYLNHHRFPRSERPERVGRSPHELLTGEPQPHWLDQLTNARLQAV